MLFYIVAYDIPCNKRRKKVSDLLEGYGRRVQGSVFELILERAKYRELQQRLRRRVKVEEDSIRFYPISKHTVDQVEAWGGLPVMRPQGSIII